MDPATAQTLLYAFLFAAVTRQALRPATIYPEKCVFFAQHLASAFRPWESNPSLHEAPRTPDCASGAVWRCLVCSRLRSTNSNRRATGRGAGAPHSPPEFPLEKDAHAAKCLWAGARNCTCFSRLHRERRISCERLVTNLLVFSINDLLTLCTQAVIALSFLTVVRPTVLEYW